MQSTFDRVMAEQQQAPAVDPNSIANIYSAYKSGKMSPDQAAEFESDVNAGHIMLPKGAALNASSTQKDNDPTLLPQSVTEAYVAGKLTPQQKSELEDDIRSGLVKLPPSLKTQSDQASTQNVRVPNWDSNGNVTSYTDTHSNEQGIIPAPEPSAAQKVWNTVTAPIAHPIATLDAAAATVSNMVLGTAGMVAGDVHSITKSILDGTFGSSSESDIAAQQKTVENDIKAATSIGWQPHSEQAQQLTNNVGEAMSAVAPALPMTAEMNAIGQSSRLASPALNATLNKVTTPIKNIAADAIDSTGGAMNKVKQVFSKEQQANSEAAATSAEVQPIASANDLAGDARSAAIGGFGSQKATANLAEQVKPDAEVLAAADRQGVADSLQPDHYSTNLAYRQLAQFLKSQTGSEAAAAERSGLGKIAQKANNVIAEIGGTDDISTLSEKVGKTLQETHDKLKATAKDLYGEAESKIGLRTAVDAENTLAAIKNNAENMGGIENVSPAEKALIKQLTPTEDYQPTYALLDKIRKDIGEAKRGKQNVFGSSNATELGNLETALRADQKVAADAAGVGDVWEKAQATAKMYKGIQEDLTSIFGKELDKSLSPLLSKSIPRLKSGDSSSFIKLIKNIPKDMRQEVVASGVKSFFQETNRGGAMNFNDFANWFEKLQKQKQAYTAIMSNLPKETVASLQDFATMARGISRSQREFLATGKAVNKDAFDKANSFIGRVYEQVKSNGVTGAVGEIAGTAHGMPGAFTAVMSAATKNKPPIMQAADRLITSKEFVDAVKATSEKSSPIAKKAAVKKLANSKKFKEFFAFVKRKNPTITKEEWISKALQVEIQNSNNLTNKQEQPRYDH